MTIASLEVRLSAVTADYHRQMEDVARRTERVGRRIAKAGLEISQAISLPLLAAGAAAFKAALDESHRSFGPLFTAWEQLKARVRDVGVALGKDLTPMFLQLIGVARSVITYVLSIVEAFSRLPSGVQKAITTTLLFLAALGPTVLVVGKLIKVLGAIPSLFAAITSPVGLAVVAIAAFAAAGLYVITHWEQVKLRMVLVWTAIKEAVFGAVDGLIGVLETLVGWIPVLGDSVKKLRADFDAWADRSLAHSAERIQELEKGLRSGTQAVQEHGAVFQAVRDVIDRYNQGMRELATMSAAIGPRFNAFAEQARLLKQQLDGVAKLSPEMRAQFEGMVMPLGQLAAMWQRADDAARTYDQALGAVSNGLLTYAAAQELANQVASGAITMQQASKILEIEAGVIQDLLGGLQDTIAAFGGAIGDMLSGVSGGFSNFGRALAAVIGGVLQQVGKAAIALGLLSIGFGTVGAAIQKFAANPLLAIGAGIALIALGKVFAHAAEQSVQQNLTGGGGGGAAAAPAPTSPEGPGSGTIVLELHGDGMVSALFEDTRNQDALANVLRDLSGRNVIVEPVTI